MVTTRHLLEFQDGWYGDNGGSLVLKEFMD